MEKPDYSKPRVSSRAQAIAEYGVVLALVLAALLTMQVYIKRAIQAGIKLSADEIAQQKEAEQLISQPDSKAATFTESKQINTIGLGGSQSLSRNETITQEAQTILESEIVE